MNLNLLKYINYRVKVTMKDGRWMEGNMLSVDNNTNVVLDDTEEFRTSKDTNAKQRILGLVLVRGNFVTEVKMISKSQP